MKKKDLLFLPPIPVSLLGIALVSTNEGLGLGIYLFAIIWYFILWITCLGAAFRMESDGNERLLWILVVFFVNIIGVYVFYFKVLRNEDTTVVHDGDLSPDSSMTLQALKEQYGSPRKHPRFKEYLAEDPARKYMESRDVQSGFISWLQSGKTSNK